MSYVAGSFSSKDQKLKKYWVIFLIALLAVLIIVGWLFFVKGEDAAQQVDESQAAQVTEPEVEEEPAEIFPDIQPVVDDWVASRPGTYSIYITDRQGSILAKHEENQVFFAASLYKLYVAYEGYRKVDEGVYKSSDILSGSRTIGACLDLMIRDSDSPCGEAMMAKLGQQYLTDKMKEYGLKGTSLNAITTTASDSALILQNVYGGVGLSASARAAYLDSMNVQDAIYRKGLPSGFTLSTVYNKVGWNLDQEWHDSAIIELPDGRVLVVSVLSTDAGYKNIAGFGQALEEALQ